MTDTKHWEDLLREEDNCWRIAAAARVAVLLEASSYFEALRQACEQAEHSIVILGWDFDRREKCGRDKKDPKLEDLLCEQLENKPGLNAYLLSWDYSFVYAAEREWFQELRLRHWSHDRLHVKFDSEHPAGGSQHQKIVVIDDRTAFCGGIDLSRWRWDTSEHAPNDPRRTDPDGNRYPPFHDMMMLVDGKAAAALGEVARKRWLDSGASPGEPPLNENRNDPWPAGVEPLWTDCRVGIARTLPAHRDREAVREVERLFIQAIQCAGEYIYIENQYFTARSITDALVERLGEADGPDVVLVLPRHTGGWLEQVTMDAIRRYRVEQLIEADKQGHLRVFYPHQPGLGEDECISVHAKLMLADDRFARIGSANASNRSMGLDSECDLAIVETGGGAVSGLLNRLLAEHLDCAEEEIEKERQRDGRLVDAIDSLRREQGRSLRILDVSGESPPLNLKGEEDVIDPDEPIASSFLFRRAVPPGRKREGHHRLYLFLGLIVLLLLVAASWRWTPMSESLTAERIQGWLSMFEQPLVRFTAVVLAIAVTTLLMVPLTPLVVASALLLGPWMGFAGSMGGALISSAAAFIAGELMGGQLLEKYSEGRIHDLSKRLSERGVLAIAVLRMVPVAPFTVVNLVAGASHVSIGRYMLGTLIGLLPGIAALSWFSGSLYRAVTEPGMDSLGVLLLVTVFIGAGVLLLRRVLKDS